MKFIALVAPLALAGCIAANPDSIEAVPSSMASYSQMDCATLAAEDARVAARLGPLIQKQYKRREADTLGLVFVGITPSGLGQPDHAEAISRLKGERESIALAKAERSCPQPQAPLAGL